MKKNILLFIILIGSIGGCTQQQDIVGREMPPLHDQGKITVSSGIIYTTGSVVYNKAFVQNPTKNETCEVYEGLGTTGYLCQSISGYRHVFRIAGLDLSITAYTSPTLVPEFVQGVFDTYIEPIIETTGSIIYTTEKAELVYHEEFIERKSMISKKAILAQHKTIKKENIGDIEFYEIQKEKYDGLVDMLIFKHGKPYYYFNRTKTDCNPGPCPGLSEHTITYFTD